MPMKNWGITYLRHVMDSKGWNGAELAKRSGVSASTINRPLNDADWSNNLSLRTLLSVAKASGIDYKRFMPQDGLAEDAPPPLAIPRAKAKSAGIHIEVDGKIAHIQATITLENIEEVRRKLALIEQLLKG